MTENPYEPPDVATLPPPIRQPLLPLWRRVVSVTLVTLGVVMTPALLASPLAFGIWLFDLIGHGEPHYLMSVGFLAEGLLAVAMIWGGIRLRRTTKSRFYAHSATGKRAMK
ncbi:MAG: hypothetical protein K2Y37_21590 [Pirellulales bacterium]|nr:hypothetical protein [Pirellulales bacterium]